LEEKFSTNQIEGIFKVKQKKYSMFSTIIHQESGIILSQPSAFLMPLNSISMSVCTRSYCGEIGTKGYSACLFDRNQVEHIQTL
jgi:ABC-type uncharacterized transport system ATPase subunit